MTLQKILAICLRRQRGVFVLTLLVALSAIVGMTLSLPKVYEATATVEVGSRVGAAEEAPRTEDLEAVTRTYAELLETPAVADIVVQRLPFETSRGALDDATSFEAVPGTALLRVVAESTQPALAQQIANGYVDALVVHQTQRAREAANRALADRATRIRDLTRRIGRLRARRDPQAEAELSVARSELEAAVAAYRAIEVDAARQGAGLSVASAAPVPTAPSRPRPLLYIVIGSMLAVVVAGGAALVRDSFDERVDDEEQLSDLIGAPVVARIPDFNRSVRGAVDDAYQLLRSNLQLLDRQHRLRVLAVVSAKQGEGKSVSVSRLARALAVAGARVVAVDGDMRRPTLHTLFGGHNDQGLSTFLESAPAGTLHLQEDPGGDARFLAAGPKPPNPPVLLTSNRLEQLLSHLHHGTEYVLVDTPPVTIGADASLIAAASDGVLLVADLRRSRRASLVETRAQLEKAGTHIVGIVVNRAGNAPAYQYGEGRLRQLREPRARAGAA